MKQHSKEILCHQFLENHKVLNLINNNKYKVKKMKNNVLNLLKLKRFHYLVKKKLKFNPIKNQYINKI